VPKTIVYLDHNFVSNLAKARLGRISDAGQQGYYVQLFEVLETLVLDNRIVCPRSTSHDLEAELDERLDREIGLTIESVARGVRFLDDAEVLNSQVTKALYKYLGKDPPEPFAPWAEAFVEDPQAPVVRDLPPANVRIRVPGRPGKARWVKKRYVEEIRSVRQRRLERPPAFDMQVRRETLSLAASYYFEPFRVAYEPLATGRGWDVGAFESARHTLALYRHYSQITGDESYNLESPSWSFFGSDEFARVPYVDIFCSLYAGSLVYSAQRQPQEGDLYDVSAVATALPYCDVLATDAYMKWLIHRLRLDAKYGVEVFSARRADLTAFLTRLTALAWVLA
jgi:hypothetical protein